MVRENDISFLSASLFRRHSFIFGKVKPTFFCHGKSFPKSPVFTWDFQRLQGRNGGKWRFISSVFSSKNDIRLKWLKMTKISNLKIQIPTSWWNDCYLRLKGIIFKTKGKMCIISFAFPKTSEFPEFSHIDSTNPICMAHDWNSWCILAIEVVAISMSALEYPIALELCRSWVLVNWHSNIYYWWKKSQTTTCDI